MANGGIRPGEGQPNDDAGRGVVRGRDGFPRGASDGEAARGPNAASSAASKRSRRESDASDDVAEEGGPRACERVDWMNGAGPSGRTGCDSDADAPVLDGVGDATNTNIRQGRYVEDRLCPAVVRDKFVSADNFGVADFVQQYVGLLGAIAEDLEDDDVATDCDISVDAIRPSHPSAGGASGNGAGPSDRAADPTSPSPPRRRSSRRGQLAAPDDVVIRVAIFHPDKIHTRTQEVLVLGSQPLTALRDCIRCPRDAIDGHHGLGVPSAFLYVNKVFYDDMRDPRAVRYSTPIMDFITHRRSTDPNRDPKGGAGTAGPNGGGAGASAQFAVRDMEHTTFAHLDFKLGSGFPCVYCHQGCCEHKVAFMDMRLLHADDSPFVDDYPRTVFERATRRKLCQVCGLEPAKRLVYGEPLAPSSPCALCEECHACLGGGGEVYDYPLDIPRE